MIQGQKQLQVSFKNHDQDLVSDEPRMGAMWLLNSLKGQIMRKKIKSKTLMIVIVKINGKPTKAMMYIGVTHNFITEGKAKCLGPRLKSDSSHINEMNSTAKPIHGIAC